MNFNGIPDWLKGNWTQITTGIYKGCFFKKIYMVTNMEPIDDKNYFKFEIVAIEEEFSKIFEDSIPQ